MEMSQPELLPCPCCGGDAKLSPSADMDGKYYVKCSCCKMETAWAVNAVQLWNKRHATTKAIEKTPAEKLGITPGEWTAIDKLLSFQSIDRRYSMATTCLPRLADAKLCSAAPDLYNLVFTYRHLLGNTYLNNTADAAIKKAGGQTDN